MAVITGGTVSSAITIDTGVKNAIVIPIINPYFSILRIGIPHNTVYCTWVSFLIKLSISPT
jgi:hypothetical protein